MIARVRQLDTQLDQQRRLIAERQGLERQLGDLQGRIGGPQRQVDQLQAEAQVRWGKGCCSWDRFSPWRFGSSAASGAPTSGPSSGASCCLACSLPGVNYVGAHLRS